MFQREVMFYLGLRDMRTIPGHKGGEGRLKAEV